MEEKESRKRKELIFFISLPGVRLPRTKARGALIDVRSLYNTALTADQLQQHIC